jgi:hypothetical protein
MAITRTTYIQTVEEALTLMRRQAVLEAAMKRPGGVRVTEEQELHVVRRRLTEFPDATRFVQEAAHALRRPIGELSASDIERWANSQQVA